MSNSLLVPGDESSLAAMVGFSRRWNAAVGITGALVSTELHFVQFIEGPDFAISDLLGKLRTDTRHTRMTIIETAAANQRQFERWSLAYSGPDTFIDRELTPILQGQSARSRRDTAADLRMLLACMADQGSP